MAIYRKQFTQAKLNLSTWKFLVIEILIVSFGVATYFNSIYVFAIALFSLLTLFYLRLTFMLISSFFSLMWGLLPSILISTFKSIDFIESLPELLSSPSSQILALIIFIVSFYFHITGADFLRDALEPIMGRFINKERLIRKE
mgnify:CR=1 FL=1|tara:strand:- start:1035 stop:1463 length:429 start_codon:yes stop_codon:yes gene_type:complete